MMLGPESVVSLSQARWSEVASSCFGILVVVWCFPPDVTSGTIQAPACIYTPAIIEKGIPLNTFYRRFASVGLLAIAVVVTGLVGCDSTPAPPTDASPPMPKQTDALPGAAKKQLGKTIPRSIKDLSQRPVAPPETKPSP
jgi:hypothetical protein